jgi:hypothetical protein
MTTASATTHIAIMYWMWSHQPRQRLTSGSSLEKATNSKSNRPEAVRMCEREKQAPKERDVARRDSDRHIRRQSAGVCLYGRHYRLMPRAGRHIACLRQRAVTVCLPCQLHRIMPGKSVDCAAVIASLNAVSPRRAGSSYERAVTFNCASADGREERVRDSNWRRDVVHRLMDS